MDAWYERPRNPAEAPNDSPNTRVIIISANDDYSVRNAAIESGAIAFFVKPFDDESFLSAVHQAMASKT